MEDTVFDSPQSFGDPQDELGGIPGGIGQLYRSADSTRQGATVTAERYPSFQTPGPMSMSPRAEYATPGRMEGPTVTAEQPDGAVVTGEGPPPRANPANPAPTERDSTGEVRPPEVNPEVPNANMPTRPSAANPSGELGRFTDAPDSDPQTMTFPGKEGPRPSDYVEVPPEQPTSARPSSAQPGLDPNNVFANRSNYLPEAGSAGSRVQDPQMGPDKNQMGLAPGTSQNAPAPPAPRQSPGRSAAPEFPQGSAPSGQQTNQTGGQNTQASPESALPPEARPQQSGQQNDGQYEMLEDPMFTKEFNRRRMARRQQRQQGGGRQQRGGQQGGYSYEEFRREFKNAGRDPSAYLRKMEMVPADASEEEIRSMVEEGKIPFFNPATGEPPEYEPINLDLSGQKNAIRELADAKIQAAKKGVATGEENVRAANARLLANAFGPGLFQALTGTQQPTNQTTNYARSARKAGRELRNAEQRAARVEATANAKADQQIASMEAEEALRFAQDKRKMKQLNAELERNRRNAVAEARQGMISRALNMSQQDAQLGRQLAQAKLEAAQEARSSGQQFDPAVQSIRAYRNQVSSLNSGMARLKSLSNALVDRDLTDEQENRIKREIGKALPKSGGMIDIGNKDVTTMVQERVQDMYSQRQQLLKQVPQTLEQANSPEAYREYRRLRQQANRPINQETEREFGGPGPASGVRYADDVLNESRQVTGNGGNNNPQNRATNSGSTNERASGQDNGTSENTGAFFDSVFNPMQ